MLPPTRWHILYLFFLSSALVFTPWSTGPASYCQFCSLSMSEKPNGFTGFTVNPSLFHVLMNVAPSSISTSFFFSYSVQSFIASWSLSSPSWAACCCNGLSSPCQNWYHQDVLDCPWWWWWWCPVYSSSNTSSQPNSESLRTEKSLHVLCLPYFSESLCWNTLFLCDVTRGIHDWPLPLSCFEIIMLLPHFQICGRSKKASF